MAAKAAGRFDPPLLQSRQRALPLLHGPVLLRKKMRKPEHHPQPQVLIKVNRREAPRQQFLHLRISAASSSWARRPPGLALDIFNGGGQNRRFYEIRSFTHAESRIQQNPFTSEKSQDSNIYSTNRDITDLNIVLESAARRVGAIAPTIRHRCR